MIKVVLVDKKDKRLGLKEKYEAHKLPVPLHRGVSVLIFSPDKTKMLLQKRAEEKVTWPGYWSNAACTHPLSNELYLDAAERRLKEEMGFCVSLSEVLRFFYEARYDRTWGEHEYDIVFEGTYDGEVKPDSDEVSGYKWIEIEDLYTDIKKNPKKYTPWFKIILKKSK
jgi:isopentenyl-diphosphate delta-isomerase